MKGIIMHHQSLGSISCPMCQGSFRQVVREGIVIDICNQCQGVWLDRGELEKLLQTVHSSDHHHAPSHRGQGIHSYDKYKDNDDDYEYRRGHGRKKSKLESIFDIFD